MSGRYVPRRFAAAWGKGEPWGVVDQAYNPDEWIADWRKKGSKRLPWRGTKADAYDLASLLNRNASDIANVTKTPTHLSQVVRYAKLNENRRGRPVSTRTRAKSGAAPVPNFKRCTCGAMYKGEKHCG